MRRFATLVGLALRELWISYRMLVMLGALLLAALPASLVPQLPAPALLGVTLAQSAWYAAGLAAALTLAAGIAAGTLAGELRRGTLSWLVVRAVPHTTILIAWFGAFTLVLAFGVAVSAALAALSLGEPLHDGRTAAFVAITGAVAAAGLAAIASALLVGALLSPVTAVLVTILVVGGTLLAATLGSPSWSPLPVAGLAILAGFDDATSPIADALRSAGTALALAASLLVLAAARLERVDL